MSRSLKPLTWACLSLALLTAEARAAIVTFIGEDLQPTANVTVRTNADAAATAFTTAAAGLGTVATITFEGAPLGAFNNLSVAAGVSINGSDNSGNPQTIRNVTNFPSYPSVDGTNTTSGGAYFVEMIGGTLTFTFAQPTQFFGFYLTGVQTAFYADNVTFSDGSNQSITLAGTGTNRNVGEVAFLGFTDAGRSISSITITASNANGFDAIGVDDVMFQAPRTNAVPEPSALFLMLAGLGLIGIVRRRRHFVA